MKRSSAQYRPLRSDEPDPGKESSDEGDAVSLDSGLRKKTSPGSSNDENGDYVDYMGQQSSDKEEQVKFLPGNQKRRKKFQQWIPEQFIKPKRGVPWKSIMFAIGLFLLGTILLLCGCLIHIGKVDNDKYGDRLWPLIIFGLLMFIPGSYHVYLVINVFLGKPGYTFDEFPQFED